MPSVSFGGSVSARRTNRAASTVIGGQGECRPAGCDRCVQRRLSFVPFSEESSEWRIQQMIENDAIDSKYGFDRVADYLERTGFLLNMHTVRV